MANQNTTIRLKDRIKTDLEDLYNSGILTFIQQFKNCKIKAAEQLSNDLFGTPNELSSHGLPGYYTGKRDAKTVMVMLNPGSDVISQDNPFVTEMALERTMKELGINNPSSSADFVNLFVQGSNNYGNIDKDDKGNIRIDNFDIKQAAFLKTWVDRDFTIPNDFPDKLKNLPPRLSKEEKEKINELLRETKQTVLMKKLQLELIPYASREFKKVEKEKMHFLFPYVETLFDEIFSKERNYVIFCSDFFDTLFRMYSDDTGYTGSIVFGDKEEWPFFQNDRKACCTPIKITYNKGKAMTSIHAVIAHTFPNKALPNAYDKMQKYGELCFECYNDYKKRKP